MAVLSVYRFFERDGWVCVYCQERASQVHHKTYKNLGNETFE